MCTGRGVLLNILSGGCINKKSSELSLKPLFITCNNPTQSPSCPEVEVLEPTVRIMTLTRPIVSGHSPSSNGVTKNNIISRTSEFLINTHIASASQFSVLCCSSWTWTVTTQGEVHSTFMNFDGIQRGHKNLIISWLPLLLRVVEFTHVNLDC